MPAPYFHVVFTLPHALNALIAQNRRALYNLLFSSASATLLTFGHQRFGAQIGITAVLHTWSQSLGPHYHLHCIVTGGGLSRDGQSWRRISAGYLFPVTALSLVFRAKFRDGLKKLYNERALSFHGQLAALHDPGEFRRLLATALRQKWVVFTKRPFGGPREVLAYLSRYTHRVAIGNGRLLALDSQQGAVSFSYKDYADHHRRKIMTLSLPEFLRRFTLHILPPRYVKIRHYGLLGNHQRQEKIAKARRLLGVCPPEHNAQAPDTPAPEAQAAAPAKPLYPTCPHCGSANLILIERHCRPPPLDSS